MNIDLLIDQFVDYINSRPREPKQADEVPPSLRTAQLDENLFDWQIMRSDHSSMIAELEKRLPSHFPPSFRSLVTRYSFPAVESGSLILLANTKEGTDLELRDAIFSDPALSPSLLASGLLQFARPESMSYDPVCFHAGTKRRDGEFPIVRIEHEAALCHDTIRIIETIALSFVEFVQKILNHTV